MSCIQHVQIQHFRNLTAVKLEPGLRYNVLYGQNGSGKTSFLESLHFLGLGRSFRSRLTTRIIEYEQDHFTLHAKVKHHAQTIPIGIEKRRGGESTIRVNDSNASSAAALADMLPLQLLYPDGNQLLSGGPKCRRQFMDWGVFHVEHQFLPLWQRAQRAIQQRNASLKLDTATHSHIKAWNQELTAVSDKLHLFRENYIIELQPLFDQLLEKFLPEIDVALHYQRGWDKHATLAEVLDRNFSRDHAVGYTQFGPHRADIWLRTHNKPLHEVLSQGQQKLVIYALRLAQGMLLKQQTNKQCVYLIDDLPAELDRSKRGLVTKLLTEMQAQVFVTGIEPQMLENMIGHEDTKMFHVEHGTIVAE